VAGPTVSVCGIENRTGMGWNSSPLSRMAAFKLVGCYASGGKAHNVGTGSSGVEGMLRPGLHAVVDVVICPLSGCVSGQAPNAIWREVLDDPLMRF